MPHTEVGMSLWEAVLLGVVQGLTEFLPISSTAHLVLIRQLLGHEKPNDAYTTAIQLGTLVAVFAYFRADVLRLLRALVADVRALRPGSTPDARLGWMIVVGTIPVVACGLLFRDFIKGPLYGTPVIAGAAIFFALVLLEAEVMARRRPGRGEEEITWRDALLIGLFQALALIPGASRSGVTITAGLFAGLSRPAAARFSFLLSLPGILGAGLYDSYKDRESLFGSDSQTLNLFVGAAVAAVVGYASIAWLLRVLKRYSTAGFVVYRLILGTLILGLWMVDRLK
jgi:undecaprenyl-diphosphatase